MAVTKVYAIRGNLGDSIGYAFNAEKTGGLVSALNCSPGTAFEEMQETKRRYFKTDKVLGYHFIQSFAPGEVTAEQAHKIGMEFAGRLFGGRFEAVVGTHLDKGHYHSHIIINSVSFADGKKYRSNKGTYYKDIRAVSDQLCREHGLSVVAPQGKGLHYAEWAERKAGRPTLRDMVREDIDDCIRRAYHFKSFIELLKQRGYEVKHGSNVKHIAVRAPEGKRFIRLEKSYGTEYSEAGIKQQLERQRLAQAPPEPPPKFPRKTIPKHTKKLHGFAALYYKYLYMLGMVKRRQVQRSQPSKEDVLKFRQYRRQFLFLHRNKLNTMQEFEDYRDALESKIQALQAERRPLYAKRRGTGDTGLTNEIDRITDELRGLYGERRICRQIAETAPRIQEAVQGREEQALYAEQPKKKQYRFR